MSRTPKYITVKIYIEPIRNEIVDGEIVRIIDKEVIKDPRKAWQKKTYINPLWLAKQNEMKQNKIINQKIKNGRK